MENVYFEGLTIKATKNGVYYCPFKCGRSDYPRPKWKTTKGFISHLNCCSNRPEAVARREEEAKIEQERKDEKQKLLDSYQQELEAMKEDVLAELPLKLGDTIFYVVRIVVKDTHEQRGNRMVKVRYEPILRFEAVKETIKKISFKVPEKSPTKEYATSLIVFNDGVRIGGLKPTWEDACNEASERTKGDEEYRSFASFCR